MPRVRDKSLEDRILIAAHRILRKRGDAGLTLRSVAKAARTSTPTVYKRFRNKEALLIALAVRLRGEFLEALFACKTLEAACGQYLKSAEKYPSDYNLLWALSGEIFHPRLPRPGLEWARAQLAARFGGQPRDYVQAAYALFLICHGAATLMTIPIGAATRHEVRQHTQKICNGLLSNIKVLNKK